MKKTVFLCLFILSFGVIDAQSTYFKEYSGLNFISFVQLNDGAILVGTPENVSNSNRNRIVRIDSLGVQKWVKKIDANLNIDHVCHAANGLFVAGDNRLAGNSGPRKSFLSYTTLMGEILWSKEFVTTGFINFPNNLIPLNDGVILLGRFYPQTSGGVKTQPYATRFDTDGNVVWSKQLNFSSIQTYALEYTTGLIDHDTLYIGGQVQGNPYIGRYSLETGDIIDWVTFGGIYDENIFDLKPTMDGNFIVSGYTRSTTGSEEDRPWVVKLNHSGEIIWSKTYNIPGAKMQAFVETISDGNFFLSLTRANSNQSLYDLYAKLDAEGQLIFAKNYPPSTFRQSYVQKTADGNFMTANGSKIRKVNPVAEIAAGCCVQPQSMSVEDFNPPIVNYALHTEDWVSPQTISLTTSSQSNSPVLDACSDPIASIIREIQVCQGDSIEINGAYYQAPATVRDTLENTQGGCDTLLTYNLKAIPQPFVTQTVWICEGNTLNVNGVEYVAPDVIFDILPSATACDTLSVIFLNLRPFLPIQWDTTFFCPGDTVFFQGNAYYSHNSSAIIDTIVGLNNTCDTLRRKLFSYPVTQSVITTTCPPNIEVHTSPGVPVPVFYDKPSAITNCGCDSIQYLLQQGLASGEIFPEGNTLVCYSATDVCNSWQNCCFEVNVIADELPCDEKETACIRYELLDISTNSDQQKTYRMRVTNTCASPMNYTAFQIPQGITAENPAQNSTYTTPNGAQYTVRNPNTSPFRSIRFKTQGNGLANGQSDIFEYTLPAQSAPTFIQAFSRLESGASFSATLNVFDCPVVQQNRSMQRLGETAETSIFKYYPNPSSGEVFLHWPTATQSDWQYDIFSAQGQKVQTGQIEALNGKASIKLAENLSDGIYSLFLRNRESESQVARLVLIRGR